MFILNLNLKVTARDLWDVTPGSFKAALFAVAAAVIFLISVHVHG